MQYRHILRAFAMFALVLSPAAGAQSGDPAPGTWAFITFDEIEGFVDEGGTATLTARIDYEDGVVGGVPVSVTVRLSGGTANAGDIDGPTPSVITFSGEADGEIRTVSVTAVDDDEEETTETALFQFANPMGGNVQSSGTFRLTIVDNDASDEISVWEARALGAGNAVIVAGTVSRAQGAFTYIQDDRAGLAIRQTSGAFADAVASGALRPGTEVTLTGMLSEEDALLMIDGADLTDFTIGETDDAPTPRVVNVIEIGDFFGEDHESVLVTTVNSNTIDAQGATVFEPNTSYTITDDLGDTAVLYVPDAADTDAEGTPIPTGTVALTGVVGQWSQGDPDTGYRLVLTRAAGVEVLVSSEAAPRDALALTVANPLRGVATVRYATGTTGTASLTLHDALGRRVATLADGETDGGSQTATLDATALAPGVYVLRLDAGGALVTRTLAVVR